MSKLFIARTPQDDDELWEYVYTISRFKIPRVSVCREHCAPFDAFADAYFARSVVSVWKASRGFGGKSTLLGLLTWVEAVTLGAQVSVLGGSASQSRRVHEVTHELWHSDYAPVHLLDGDPTNFYTRLKNRAWIIALMASQKSVRGPHPQRLRLDEIDEMDNDILESAQGQPQEARGIESHTVMSSTHQYPDKTMTLKIKEAREKGWPVWEWSISEGTLITTQRGQVPIEEVWPGEDKVLTRNGWRDVQHVTRMGVKPTVTIRTVLGKTLTLTDDHKVASGSEWVRAGDLSLGLALTAVRTLAGTADPRPVSPETSVLGRVLMPAGASGACGLCDDVRRPGHVHTMGDIFEMVGVATSSVTTDVVNLPTDRVTAEESPSQPVSKLLSPLVGCLPDHSVSISVASQSPTPTPIAGLGCTIEDVVTVHDHHALSAVGSIGTGLASSSGAVLADWSVAVNADADFVVDHVASICTGPVVPVWDIGVHDDHEFVAGGIVVHNCWRESMGTEDEPGWLTQRMVDRKRAEVSTQMWNVEYDLQEPSFDGRAIETALVDICFDPDLGEYEGEAGSIVIAEEPIEGESYVTGVDWAQENDWTVIRTFKTGEVWQEVAFERVNRMPWPWMIALVEKRLNKYGGRLIHDATGIGNVVKDLLDWPSELTTDMVMTGNRRTAMFVEYIAGIEQKEIRCPRITFSYEEHKFVTPDDLFGRGHPPDSFVAGALAWSARKKLLNNLISPGSITKESQWTLT